MKACYFGSYFRNYPRNETIIEGLRQNNVNVIECHPDFDVTKHTPKILPKIYMKLLEKIMSLKKDFDIIIVGYPGWYTFWLAKLVSLYTRKPVIFDAFISLYNTMVLDRQIVDKKSFFAKSLYLLDKYSMKFADLCITDTLEHIRYFSETFHIPVEKFRKVPVGANEKIFYSRNNEVDNENFNVLFYGYFTPLHGLDVILHAAKLLESKKNIKFLIIGKTIEGNVNVPRISTKNVRFLKPISYIDLPKFISKSQICLGIFGKTRKAKLVVPNKIYQSIAMKKAVITADTPAMHEEFTNMKNIFLCDPTPESLADAVLLLEEDKILRNKIAKSAYQLFINNFTTKKVGERMKELCSLR